MLCRSLASCCPNFFSSLNSQERSLGALRWRAPRQRDVAVRRAPRSLAASQEVASSREVFLTWTGLLELVTQSKLSFFLTLVRVYAGQGRYISGAVLCLPKYWPEDCCECLSPRLGESLHLGTCWKKAQKLRSAEVAQASFAPALGTLLRHRLQTHSFWNLGCLTGSGSPLQVVWLETVRKRRTWGYQGPTVAQKDDSVQKMKLVLIGALTTLITAQKSIQTTGRRALPRPGFEDQ